MAPRSMALFAVGAMLCPGVQAARPEAIFRESERVNLSRPSDEEYRKSLNVDFVGVKGRGAWAKNCEPFPGKRVVLVTLSEDYFQMFTNWLDSAKLFLRETEQLHVIAEDESIVKPLQDYLERAEGTDSGFEFSYSVASAQQAASLLQPPWGKEGYGAIVWERPDHILKLLSVGCSVLYVDIDTVWMKDPFHIIEAAGFSELYITDDSPPEQLRNLCTCFLLLHPTDKSKALMQAWSEAMDGDSNQHIFNRVLQKRFAAHEAPKMTVLPLDQFPPGNLILRGGIDWMKAHILDTAPENPTIYHANWRIGNADKVHFFQMLDVWKPPPRNL